MLSASGWASCPELESESALARINVFSGSGAECSTDRPYVAPGDASDSFVYEKLLERSPCGERMPLPASTSPNNAAPASPGASAS